MNTDVIIVGAGQAGCAAAFDLAAAGRQVLLLDKPQGKPCAGGVTNKALNLLRFSSDAIVRERPLQLDLTLNGWRPLHWPLEAPMCVMTERTELDALCLQKAKEAGVDYQIMKQVVSLRQSDAGVELITDIGTFRASFVIAADGAHSPLRRLLLGGEKAAGAYAIEGKVLREKANRYPGMQFDFQAAKNGYGWLFPKGDHINVGLYVSRMAAEHKPGREALKSYTQRSLGCDDLDDIAGYPLGTRMHHLRLAAGRVLFAGDAAGACEPLLGEGIYGAILTGQLTAAAILQQMEVDRVANTYIHTCAEWRREIAWLNRIARAFYAVTPLSYGALHHGLRRALTRGYAAGWTPLQCTRLLRGAKLAGPE